MNRKEIKNITKFLKAAYNSCANGYEGCWYHHLSDMLYVVAAQGNEDNEVVAKIAYNCDSLQCDYEWDWEMPWDEDSGDVWNTEIPLSKGQFRKDAEWFFKNCNAMLRELKKGRLITE